jgi:hydrogenase nickel incorporation protein HypA/HybF
VHELSLASQLVKTATEIAQQHRAERVRSITLKVGVWSCVHPPALQSAFRWLAEGTLLEDTELKMIEIPLTVRCEACGGDKQLTGIQSLRCPDCGRACGEVREGRELEIETMEILADDGRQ